VPIFGFGVLLAAWAVGGCVLLAWAIRKQGLNSDTWGYLPLLAVSGALIYFLPNVFDDGLPIRGYGVMMLLGVVSGVALAAFRARRMGIDPEIILSLAFWMFLSGVIGARTFYVVRYWKEFQQETAGQTVAAILNVSKGGLVVYGSLVAVGIAVAVFVRKYKLPGLALADLIAPSMALGLALGRVGCLMNGCCFGGECQLPWKVTFPWASPPHEWQAEHGRIDIHGLRFGDDPAAEPTIAGVVSGSAAERAGLKAGDRIVIVEGIVARQGNDGAPHESALRFDVENNRQAELALLRIYGEGSVLKVYTRRRPGDPPNPKQWTLAAPTTSLPVHPVQLYCAITALVLCLFLLAYHPLRRRDGEVIALLLTIYPVARFFEERIRTDEPPILGTWLNIAEWTSLAILAAAAALWIVVLRQPRGTRWQAPGTDLN
jgi:phosphatidylglycerol:prolipoprotein diacylglycerol transferase